MLVSSPPWQWRWDVGCQPDLSQLKLVLKPKNIISSVTRGCPWYPSSSLKSRRRRRFFVSPQRREQTQDMKSPHVRAVSEGEAVSGEAAWGSSSSSSKSSSSSSSRSRSIYSYSYSSRSSPSSSLSSSSRSGPRWTESLPRVSLRWPGMEPRTPTRQMLAPAACHPMQMLWNRCFTGYNPSGTSWKGRYTKEGTICFCSHEQCM